MATVRAATASMHGEPRISSPMISQLVAGAAVTELDAQGDWHRIRSADGYEGWMHRGYLSPSSGGEATWRLSLGCLVRLPTGLTRALPLGARIMPTDDVVAGETLDAGERAMRFPSSGDAIVGTARRYFTGASYVWGGGTPWGCDCSGLVQSVFALHGTILPRDAWQQAQTGVPSAVGDGAEAMHMAGTLLFFSDRDDRKITHVGIATGDGGMIHSALSRGGYAEERMTSEDGYVRALVRNATAARTVL